MTKNQKEQKLTIIKNTLAAHGYELDRYGNYSKIRESGDKIRYKFNETSIRCEVQIVFENGKKEWTRVASAYYKDVTISNGKLCGLKI